jgi:hypothetical protein
MDIGKRDVGGRREEGKDRRIGKKEREGARVGRRKEGRSAGQGWW